MNAAIIIITSLLAIAGWIMYIHALYRIKVLSEEIEELIAWKKESEILRKKDHEEIAGLKRSLRVLEESNARFNARMKRMDEIFDSAALKDFVKKNTP